MRIELGVNKYWVYWNYDIQYPKRIQQNIERFNIKIKEQLKQDKSFLNFLFGNFPITINTTCFIIDDNIRVKNPDGTFTGLDNQLASGTVSKFAKDRHCKAYARAYSLQKALENLFPDDSKSQSNFVEQALASGVNFTPKSEQKIWE